MHIKIGDHSSHTPFPTARLGKALDSPENLWLWRKICEQQRRDLTVLQTKACNLVVSETLWPAAVSEQEIRELESRGTHCPAGLMWERQRGWTWQKVEVVWGWWIGKKRLLWGIEQKGKSEEQCQNRSHVKLPPQKVLWTQCMPWLNRVDLFCFGSVSRLMWHCSFAGYMLSVDAQVHCAAMVLKVKHLLLGCKSPGRAKTQTVPTAPADVWM